MSVETIQPVRKLVSVDASRETAFEVFTAGMASWWNPAHHIAEKPYVELEHRDLERFGAAAPEIRDSLDSPNGWSGLLQLFEESLAAR